MVEQSNPITVAHINVPNDKSRINLIVVKMTTIDIVIVIVVMGAQQWNTWLLVISWCQSLFLWFPYKH